MKILNFLVGLAVIAPLGCGDDTGQPSLLSNGCNLHTERVADLEGDEVEAGIVALDSSHIFLERVHNINVYDRRGRLLRIIGQEGEGPGEFHRIQALAVTSAGNIVAVDPPRMSILSPDGTIVSTTTMPVRINRGGLEIARGDTLFAAGSMPTNDRFGSPFAQMTFDGTLLRYFGDNEVESVDAVMAGRMMPRLIAYDSQYGVVSVKQFAFVLEQWNADGTLKGATAVENDWFAWPPARPSGTDAHSLNPESMFKGIQFDDHGRVWLVAQVPDRNWKAVKDGSSPDLPNLFDTFIEVLDPTSLHSVCSARLDGYPQGFPSPGYLATYRLNAASEPIITIWKVNVTVRPS